MSALWLAKLRAQAIRAVREEEETVGDTAELLQLDPAVVHAWCVEAGLVDARYNRHARYAPGEKRRPRSVEAVSRIRKGATPQQVCADMDITRPQLARWCLKAGVVTTVLCHEAGVRYLSVLVEGRVHECAAVVRDGVRLSVHGLHKHRVVPWDQIESWAPRISHRVRGPAPWRLGPTALAAQSAA